MHAPQSLLRWLPHPWSDLPEINGPTTERARTEGGEEVTEASKKGIERERGHCQEWRKCRKVSCTTACSTTKSDTLKMVVGIVWRTKISYPQIPAQSTPERNVIGIHVACT